jgi:hypothetical protein
MYILRSHDIGADFAIHKHGCGGVVATAFDAEYGNMG